MKKFITITALIMVSLSAFGEEKTKTSNDTTIVRPNNVTFKVEKYTTPSGKEKTEVTCTMDGKKYESTQTYAKRHETSKRFGVKPNYAVVTDKNGNQRIIIL